MPSEHRTTETEARSRAQSALRRAGLDEQQAALVADALVDAELRGRPTHGLIRLRPLCAKLAAGEPRGPIRVRRQKGGCLLLDAAGELGYLVAAAAVDRAAILAGVHGVGLVGVRGTNHAGAMGYYARRGAARGVAVTLMTNCYPQVAPFGASSAVFGTNPLAAAFPTEDEPLVIDFSTAAVTIGQLRVSLEAGEPIGPALAYDASGAPTTDPQAALDGGAVAAFGGVKGSALALWIQLMTTAVIGAAPLPPPGAEYGLTVLAFDPSRLGGRESYLESVRAIRRAMAEARPVAEGGRVLLPGQRGDLAAERSRREAITLPRSVWDEICALSDSD
jgi:LDH2 family malate/lactate/ureidoglycolate dehydrogenase